MPTLRAQVIPQGWWFLAMWPRPVFDGCELPLVFAFDTLACFLVDVVPGLHGEYRCMSCHPTRLAHTRLHSGTSTVVSRGLFLVEIASPTGGATEIRSRGQQDFDSFETNVRLLELCDNAQRAGGDCIGHELMAEPGCVEPRPWVRTEMQHGT